MVLIKQLGGFCSLNKFFSFLFKLQNHTSWIESTCTNQAKNKNMAVSRLTDVLFSARLKMMLQELSSPGDFVILQRIADSASLILQASFLHTPAREN
jgi:hypothetical protein